MHPTDRFFKNKKSIIFKQYRIYKPRPWSYRFTGSLVDCGSIWSDTTSTGAIFVTDKFIFITAEPTKYTKERVG